MEKVGLFVLLNVKSLKYLLLSTCINTQPTTGAAAGAAAAVAVVVAAASVVAGAA